MKLSMYAFYFYFNYFLIILFLFINVNSYGYLAHSVSLMTLMFASYVKLTKMSGQYFFNSKAAKRLIVISVLVIGFQLFFVSISDVIRMAYLFVMYWAFWIIFRKKQIDSNIYFKFLIYGGLMSFFLVYIGISPPLDISHSPVRLIPIPEEGWRVNIGPPGSNVHYTAIVAGIGLILGFYSILVKGGNLKRWIMVLITAYFVVFSGSRAAYIGVIGALSIIYYFNFVRFSSRKSISLLTFSWLVLLMGLIIVYSSGLYSTFFKYAISNEALSSLLKTDIDDISAGRAGLHVVHLSLFNENLLSGAGEYLRTLKKGDDVGGVTLNASSESYFTALMATNGVWSFFVFYFYAFIFSRFCKSCDVLKVALLCFALITTAGSSFFGGAYGMGVWLLLPLLSARIRIL